MQTVRHLVVVIGLLLWPALSVRAQGVGDPPGRVGRLSYIGGAVSFRPGGVDEWDSAALNSPVTAGDELWSDADSRAEVTLGSTAIRLGPYTGIELFVLDDATAQIRLSEGSLQVRVRTLQENEVIEIDTPNGAVSLLRPGTYRVDADSRGDASSITVRQGEAQVTAGGSAFSVRTRQMATVSGTDEPVYDIATAPAPDSWDQWSAARDVRSENARSARYVSRDMPGYEDLDDNGDWSTSGAYGPVWIPRHVASGWAPYRYGHWSWVDPWGWTWIDDASWGFAPFHYGRWVYERNVWGWAPGRLVAVRPVYAPALVVFLGGAQIDVGWFPLAPGEVYYPAYHVSPTYVRNVNVTTVNVTNIHITNVDITRINYRNREAPRALTLVGQETFVGGRRVGNDALPVPRDRSGMTVVGAPAIAPTRESVQPRRSDGATGGAVRRPPEATLMRRVVVKKAPPPAPVPFVVRENALQANPGRPVDPATMDKLRSGAGAERERPVRFATPSPSTPGANAPAVKPLRRAPAPLPPAARPAPAPSPERHGAESQAPPPRAEPRPPQPAQPNQPAPPPTPAPRGGGQPHVPPAQPEPKPPQPARPNHPEGQRPEGRNQPSQPSQPAQPSRPAQPSHPEGQHPEGRSQPEQGQSGRETSKDTSNDAHATQRP